MLESEPIVGILADIAAEHQALTSLLARLRTDEIERRPGGQWSAIDTLNHITAWQENALTVARAQAAPDAPAIDPSAGPGRVLGIDTEQFNRELLQRHRDDSLATALAWHNRVNGELLRALTTLPPARLLGGPGPHGAQLWYGRPAIVHPREHRQELERRLGQAR